MISALRWVPRGAAQAQPNRFDLNEEEFERIQSQIASEMQNIKLDIDDATKEETTEAQETQESEDASESESADGLEEYDMDTYEEDEGLKGIPVFGSVQGLTYHVGDEQDPYITVKETEEEEMRELEILGTDNLLLACRTEDEVSHLDIYVYAEEDDNLYVHHDIMLTSFPLCVEWMNYSIKPTENRKGNLVAIGTFEPEIEIWDLDTIDTVYPQVILGSTAATNAKPKRNKSKQSQEIQPDRHVAAVTSLSWNKTQRNLLLSGSADTTVKLWDLNTCKVVKSYNHHSDKVCALAWNPKEQTVFLTASYDQKSRVCILDSRSPDSVTSFRIGSDVECVRWDSFRSERFMVSSEDGVVRCFDGRMGSKSGKVAPLWTIHAHDAAVSALDVSSMVDGLMVTGGADKSVKIWDIREGHDKSCLASRDLGVGQVFSAEFSMDSNFVLACAGSKGKIVLWNLYDNAGVRKSFNAKSVEEDEKNSVKRAEIVMVESDEEESDHEDNNEKEEEQDDDMQTEE